MTSGSMNGFLLCLSLSLGLLIVPQLGFGQKPVNKPNVLLIMVDDLNDCIEGMGGHPQAATPNLTRFAESGVIFKRAYTNAPMCGPSRASMFTGVYPHHSHNYFQAPWYENPVLKSTRTMMEQFKLAGYQVLGSGKIMHHNKNDLWSEFANAVDYGPSPFDGEERVPHPDVPAPFSEIGWVDGSLGPFINLKGRRDAKGNPLFWSVGNPREGYEEMRYVNDNDRDPTPDEKNAQWAASTIAHLASDSAHQPFFLAVGFLRPHTPLVAPRKYFDQFPLEDLELAVIRESDDQDTYLSAAYQGDVFTLRMGHRMHQAISKSYGSSEAGLKRWTQAYLACVAAVDYDIGQVLAALDNSPFAKNTIVVIASDHGFHMGEKDYLYKNSLWEESTRVPLMMRVPGLTQPGTEVQQAVSLIHVFPTLLDLCSVSTETMKSPQGHPMDGYSMRSLLRKPNRRKWQGPEAALTVVFAGSATDNDPTRQHYAIRTNRYRYILYNNGNEELYDHKTDPFEWNNLAQAVRHQSRLKNMRNLMRKMVHPNELNGFAELN